MRKRMTAFLLTAVLLLGLLPVSSGAANTVTVKFQLQNQVDSDGVLQLADAAEKIRVKISSAKGSGDKVGYEVFDAQDRCIGRSKQSTIGWSINPNTVEFSVRNVLFTGEEFIPGETYYLMMNATATDGVIYYSPKWAFRIGDGQGEPAPTPKPTPKPNISVTFHLQSQAGDDGVLQLANIKERVSVQITSTSGITFDALGYELFDAQDRRIGYLSEQMGSTGSPSTSTGVSYSPFEKALSPGEEIIPGETYYFVANAVIEGKAYHSQKWAFRVTERVDPAPAVFVDFELRSQAGGDGAVQLENDEDPFQVKLTWAKGKGPNEIGYEMFDAQDRRIGHYSKQTNYTNVISVGVSYFIAGALLPGEELVPGETYYFVANAVVDGQTYRSPKWAFRVAERVGPEPAPDIFVDFELQNQAGDDGEVQLENDEDPLKVKFTWTKGKELSNVGYELFDAQGRRIGSYSQPTNIGDVLGLVFRFPVTQALLSGEEFVPGETYYFKANATMDGETYYSPEWAFHIGEKPPAPAFIDVPSDQYFAQPVAWAVANGITSGIGANRFGPNNICTREQIVTFLWRAAGEPEPAASENPFTDVTSDSYAYKAVLWAMENDITSGTGNGCFSPQNPCKRSEAVTFIWRANNMPDSSANTFSDVPPGAFYEKAVSWAVENDIANGTGGDKFSPDAACTRGQIVTFLYRNR